MREIKFRAWDINIKQMDYNPYGDEYLCEGTPINDIFTEKTQKSMNFILMQFTGLKDKNGKEIYEGDICRTIDYKKQKDGSTIMSEKYAFYKNIEIKYFLTIPFCGFRLQEDYEVIGNIYENPELLK